MKKNIYSNKKMRLISAFAAACLCMTVFSASGVSADDMVQTTDTSLNTAEDASTDESGVKEITVLYTNDIHSYIDNSSDINGDGVEEEIIRYSTIAGYDAQLEAEGKDVILVDAGDHIQGTAYGGLDKGETVIELMNASEYDVATLGNHEFDYDMEGCMNAIEKAAFDYVSCNFYSINADGSTENVLESYKIIEKDGVKIAFVGITTPDTISKSTPAYFQDDNGNFIYGVAGGEDGSELYSAVQTAIDAANEEADIVIALGHLGVDPSSEPWTSKEVIANTTGIDAFIDGHSHTTMECEYVANADGEEIPLTQTGYYLSAVGEMTITVDGEEAEFETKLLSADMLSDVTADAEVKAIEDEWIAEVDAMLGDKIAESDIAFTVNNENGERLIRKGETNMGDLNADSYYWYANEAAGVGCDIAFINGGGIRANIEAGEWTYLSCKMVNTFGNVLCVAEVSGQDIIDALEFGSRYTPIAEVGGFLHTAGLTYKVDTSVENTVKEDVNSVWLAGPDEYRVYDVKVYNKETGEYEPIDPDRTYRVAGTNYTLINCGDGFNMFADSRLVLDGVAEDYLAFAEYLKAFSDTDGNGYANISSVNSPLAAYSGYILNYENPAGGGRIVVAEGKEQEPTPTETPAPTQTPEPTETPEPTTTPELTETTVPTTTPEPTTTAAPTKTPGTSQTAKPTSTAGTEKNAGKTNAKSADTGDDTNAMLLIVIIAAAAAGAAGTAVYRRYR